MECNHCHEPLNMFNECTNLDCPEAHRAATRGASRETAKAAAGHATFEPSAFTSSGRVD